MVVETFERKNSSFISFSLTTWTIHISLTYYKDNSTCACLNYFAQQYAMEKLSYPTWGFPEVIWCSPDRGVSHVAEGRLHHGLNHIIEVAGGIVVAWVQPLHCSCGAKARHSSHHSWRVPGGPGLVVIYKAHVVYLQQCLNIYST